MLSAILHVVGLTLLLAACLLAVASLVVGLPGTFLIVGAAFLYAWATGFSAVTWATLGWLLLLALTGELFELGAGALAGSGARPSRRVAIAAIAGAIAGGLVGTPFLFGAGALPGALLGSFGGATLAAGSEGQQPRHALRAGLTAMRGRLLGFVVKVALAVMMLVVLAVTAI